MPSKYPWFERTFSFDFPASKHPDILERLRGAPIRVESKIASIAPPEFLTRRVGETWSIQENVGHLLDLEPLWHRRTEEILEGVETMCVADLTNTKTHEANHHASSIEDLMKGFRASRERWLARLDALADEDFALTSNHPRLGTPMRLVDLCLFTSEHDDCHLARMTELARLLAKETANR
ncbi:MAG: DinB family protein [Planctomycetota bacterium]|nr:DinB family protein [Planctomycetota bacterium]